MYLQGIFKASVVYSEAERRQEIQKETDKHIICSGLFIGFVDNQRATGKRQPYPFTKGESEC